MGSSGKKGLALTKMKDASISTIGRYMKQAGAKQFHGMKVQVMRSV